jgi:hypothetical protein
MQPREDNSSEPIFRSIYHLVGHEKFSGTGNLAHMSFEHVRALRRYVNADLDNLSIEFYLQRRSWALDCLDKKGVETHRKEALKDPAHHPCAMRGGFKDIVDEKDYTYEEFLGETLSVFVAIHSHLVSINRALGNLYYYATEAPFSSFTPTGKSEIRNLTRQLNRMTPVIDLYQTDDPSGFGPQVFPVTCLPWSAGVYLDFLAAYEDIALHVMAVLVWAIRLYSLWYFVPRRYLRLIAPIGTIYGKM